MVVTINTPAVAERLDFICQSITVGISESSDFTSLSGIQPAVFPCEPQYLVQSLSKQVIFCRTDIVVPGIGDEVNIASAGRDSEATVRQWFQCASFEDNFFRYLKSREWKEIVLGLCILT